jgi:hypothetical protein
VLGAQQALGYRFEDAPTTASAEKDDTRRHRRTLAAEIQTIKAGGDLSRVM